MTMLLYRMNDTWEIMVSSGKSVPEEEFRITVMWIATQMQVEFDLHDRGMQSANPRPHFAAGSHPRMLMRPWPVFFVCPQRAPFKLHDIEQVAVVPRSHLMQAPTH